MRIKGTVTQVTGAVDAQGNQTQTITITIRNDLSIDPGAMLRLVGCAIDVDVNVVQAVS